MDLGTVHRARCRPFKVHSFTVVTTAMAGTLKFVFAGSPVGSTAEMCATSIDHKNSIRRFVYPDPILLLPLRVYAKRIVGGKTDAKNTRWFEDCARKKEPQEHQKTGGQKPCDAGPHDATTHLVDRRFCSAFQCRDSFNWGSWRGNTGWGFRSRRRSCCRTARWLGCATNVLIGG